MVRKGSREKVVQGDPRRASDQGPVDESQETAGRLPDHLPTDVLLVPEMKIKASLVYPGGGENIADTCGADPLAMDQAASLAQDVVARPFALGRHGPPCRKLTDWSIIQIEHHLSTQKHRLVLIEETWHKFDIVEVMPYQV
jgi:hypothetical protein